MPPALVHGSRLSRSVAARGSNLSGELPAPSSKLGLARGRGDGGEEPGALLSGRLVLGASAAATAIGCSRAW
eukprot:8286866-Pyramimonas_sp.AAC.1